MQGRRQQLDLPLSWWSWNLPDEFIVCLLASILLGIRPLAPQNFVATSADIEP